MMASLLCTEVIAESLDNKQPVFLVVLDAQKAFDVVDHSCPKLKSFSCSPDSKCWKREANLLDGLSASVRIDGTFSRNFRIRQAVGQGKVLSLSQYKIYINDLLTDLANSNIGAYIGPIYTGVMAYADDILLAANNCADLQVMINVYH